MKSILHLILTLFFLLSFNVLANAQKEMEQWVDSVFNSLSQEERIAQLLVVRANQPGKKYYSEVSRYIRKYNIGGVTFFRGDAMDQALMTNKWQNLAETPLFISIDAEWGLGMRVNDAISYPFQMTLGAVREDTLIYQMGKTVARQCQRLGIHINFAPVADINSNPNNPIIGMRSFGEDKKLVTRKAIAYMRGMQDQGIIPTAKHFPGHGDTDTDSHKTLPIIKHDKARLDSLELYPFREMINAGLDGIMIAHLYIPELEKKADVASTLSSDIVNKLLRKKMGFNGLIVTDALDMKGVTKYHKPGDIEVQALKAGNDILLLPENVPAAIKAIKKAISGKKIKSSLIDKNCKKILRYKYKAGLYRKQVIDTSHLIQDLNNPENQYLKHQLFEASLTLAKNTEDIIPLKRLDTLKIASLSIGERQLSPFQKMLQKYAPVTCYQVYKTPDEDDLANLMKSLEAYNLVIIDFQNTNIFSWKGYGITEASMKLVGRIASDKKVILNLSTSPYTIKDIPKNNNIAGILISYQDDPIMQEIAAQGIFGGIAINGSLPINLPKKSGYNKGIFTSKSRFGYSRPENAGIDHRFLVSVDSIVGDAISKQVFPGCRVIAAKDGILFYDKSFGYHTYENEREVEETDIYDLASLTKIIATTPAVMKLSASNKIDVDHKLSWYLPYLKGSNKEDLVIREIMAHQARLRPWIPYYQYTLEDDEYVPGIYGAEISEEYPLRVAEDLYIRKDYAYVIYDSIRNSELRDTLEYKYSDLGFYLLVPVLEGLTNQNIKDYVNDQFYKPLGMKTMGYLPRERFPLERIIPTEDDKLFRKQLLRGDVHDQGAALLGGVSGHAGLFSDANDVAIFMQMLLQKGSYGGEQILDTAVLLTFTRVQFPLNDNRRGIGFDKPQLEYEEDGPTCKSVSPESFGHSGFTGTYAWADPENNLVYIFLSNRICPDASNNKISEMDIRTKIHQAFYDAIEQGINK